MKRIRLIVWLLPLILGGNVIRAATVHAETLREQVLLNGDWPEGGKVPQYFGGKFESKTYRRTVQVPESWPAKTFNWRYPEGYEQLPKGSIYSWAAKVHSTKPSGIGEFLACPWVEKIKPEVFWWHGTWSRGLRYANFSDIRPFVMTWAWNDSQPAAKANLRSSFSPVALFDKAYDDLGIQPLMTTNYPSLEAGLRGARTLVLYNDEYRGTNLTIEVQLAADGKTLASRQRDYALPLGEHRDIPLAFDVPPLPLPLEMVLSVRKEGRVKFTEAKRFRIVGGDAKANPAPSIELGERQ